MSGLVVIKYESAIVDRPPSQASVVSKYNKSGGVVSMSDRDGGVVSIASSVKYATAII
jgi:hypothetical protein